MSQPVKHIPQPKKKKKKKKKKEPPKDTITTFRIPQEKKKSNPGPGRKKVIEICAKSNTDFFALFAFLGRTFAVL